MLDLVITQRRRDLGGFMVGRLLPFGKRRMVGPFIFFDHLGPVELPRGIPQSMDVRPHPHIGLSTVTYLFEGELMHRDSVGSQQPIRPAEVNWMTAGRGIQQAKADWRGGRMKLPDADSSDFIPLPPDPSQHRTRCREPHLSSRPSKLGETRRGLRVSPTSQAPGDGCWLGWPLRETA